MPDKVDQNTEGLNPGEIPQEANPQEHEQPKQSVLDGPDIPEAFRGKSAKDLIDQLLSNSLETEKLRTKVMELEKKTVSPPTQTPMETEKEKRARLEEEFFADPLKFLDKHWEARTRPVVEDQFKTQEQIQREFAKSRLKKFSQYEKRIDELMAPLPLEMRTKPEVWDYMYKVARGEEYDKREQELEARKGLHVEGETAPPPVKPEKRPLSDEEKRVAAKFGMTEEEYLKYA